MTRISFLFFLLFQILLVSGQTLPEGFEIEEVSTGWVGVAGLEFADNGNMYVWELRGQIWAVVDGVKTTEPIIDISDEVANYGDLGLSGFALDPHFLDNGYVYLLYAVDAHYLHNFGTPSYDPLVNEYSTAQIGRVTRFQLNTSDYITLIPDSREMIIGANIDNGLPILSVAHGTGSLVFGEDGSLFVSTGEGTTWVDYHTGGDPTPEFGYDDLGLEQGIIQPYEDVGSFRAQLPETYGGKVLRVNPETGEGYPSNPFYDELNPDAPVSKVWSLGLRNPFRINVRPNTGSINPEQGNPGVLYIGDVGYNLWEELNIAHSPGLNFGWPRFEGMDIQPGYINKPTLNTLVSNPLYNGSSCTIENLRFRDVLKQPTENFFVEYPNPCNSFEPIVDVRTFVHERPSITWMNSANNSEVKTYIPSFDENGNASKLPIIDSGISDEEFVGFTSVAGDFYYGTSFPEEYYGAYFHVDFSGWIKVMWFDQGQVLTKVEPFLDEVPGIVHLTFNPYDGCLYYTSIYTGAISKICYKANLTPVAIGNADQYYGVSPLMVQLDGTDSYDPDGDPISFHWDFGDGTESTEMSPSHEFVSNTSNPEMYEVMLTVADTSGNSSSQTLIVSLNNTPPEVNITSFEDGDLYSTLETTFLDLEAEVMDLEQPNAELSYVWQVFFSPQHTFSPAPYRRVDDRCFRSDTYTL